MKCTYQITPYKVLSPEEVKSKGQDLKLERQFVWKWSRTGHSNAVLEEGGRVEQGNAMGWTAWAALGRVLEDQVCQLERCALQQVV